MCEPYQGLICEGELKPWEELTPRMYRLEENWPEKAAVVYVRVSTEDQTKMKSLPQQVQLAVEKCRQDEHILVAVCVDPAMSGLHRTLEERNGADELLTTIEAGLIRKVYVYRRDRIARRVWQWIRFYQSCMEQSVDIELTASDEVPVSRHGQYGVVIETFLGLMAEMEGLSLSQRAKDTHAAKRRRAEPLRRPFGYVKEPGESKDARNLPCPVQGPVVRTAFDLAEEGWALSAIAARLNQAFSAAEQLPRGGQWKARTVREMLGRCEYAGYVADLDGTPQISRHIVPLVSKEQFDRVQSRVVGVKSRSAGARPSPNWLKEILRCTRCQQPMSPGPVTGKPTTGAGAPAYAGGPWRRW